MLDGYTRIDSTTRYVPAVHEHRTAPDAVRVDTRGAEGHREVAAPQAAERAGNNTAGDRASGDRAVGSSTDRAQANRPSGAASNANELTEQEQQQVRRLQQRDAEVRRHEQAHAAAGGAHAGAPQLSFERGPDGRQYAVEGHVNIDVSEVSGDPQATIAKMSQVQRAAAAPSNPSAQDRRVGAKAAQRAAEARRELATQEPADSETMGSASFATAAYASVAPGGEQQSGSNVNLVACGNCGSAHG